MGVIMETKFLIFLQCTKKKLLYCSGGLATVFISNMTFKSNQIKSKLLKIVRINAPINANLNHSNLEGKHYTGFCLEYLPLLYFSFQYYF